MARHIPQTIRKLVVNKISPKFREVTEIVQVPCQKLKQGEVLIKNRYVGVNASDINYTAGRYDVTVTPPFDCGFEGLGEVVDVGEGVTLSPGQAVMYGKFGAFSDYAKVPQSFVIKIPTLSPEFLACQLSGPTAAVALDKFGDLKEGETVLVTAAAGGTGQFAVQWAKMKGCHVIGTCSSEEKVNLLKKLGCDRPINYKEETLKSVLLNEYKDGVDVVYESVGGEMFDIGINCLKTKGRLIVIGFISGYDTELGFKPSRTITSLPVRLLQKSASVHGFFIPHFFKDWMTYAYKMSKMCHEGKLQCQVDNGETWNKGPFVGLEQIPDAVEYLYSQKSKGKIIVEMNKPEAQSKL